jgi:sRNA-binding protein
MKKNLSILFLSAIIFAYAQEVQTESLQEKKARIAQEKKDKADAKAERKAAYKRKEKIRVAGKKARQKKAAEEKNSVFDQSKEWDDYVPGSFMSDKSKGFSPNKTDHITHINDSFSF